MDREFVSLLHQHHIFHRYYDYLFIFNSVNTKCRERKLQIVSILKSIKQDENITKSLILRKCRYLLMKRMRNENELVESVVEPPMKKRKLDHIIKKEESPPRRSSPNQEGKLQVQTPPPLPPETPKKRNGGRGRRKGKKKTFRVRVGEVLTLIINESNNGDNFTAEDLITYEKVKEFRTPRKKKPLTAQYVSQILGFIYKNGDIDREQDENHRYLYKKN